MTDTAQTASQVFAGIRTQSWDVTLSADGPVFLELNYGGDLNLHQLAHGAGVLDAAYREHLRRCGYRAIAPVRTAPCCCPISRRDGHE